VDTAINPGLRDWLTTFTAQARSPDAVDRMVSRINGVILNEVPEVARAALLVQDLHASTRTHWLAFLDLVPIPLSQLVLTAPAEGLARAIARHGLDLGVLLRIYRVGHRALWDHITEVAAGVPDGGPEQIDVLTYLWSRAGSWLDQSVERLIVVYQEEHDDIAQGDIARRSEIVKRVLDRPVDERAITAELKHAVSQWQTAFVLWVDNSDDVGSLERTAIGLAHALGVGQPLSVMHGSRELWGWFATRAPIQLSARDDAVDVLAAGKARAAFGTSGPGVDGFRVSHREALGAQRVALDSQARLTDYAEIELPCIMASDRAAAETYVRRVLGPLGRSDDGLDRIRETVMAVFSADGSVEDAARKLVVHKNTVRYRLRKAEELLGERINARRADIEVALRYLETFRTRI